MNIFETNFKDDFNYVLSTLGESIKINGKDKLALITRGSNRDKIIDYRNIKATFPIFTGDLIEYQNCKWLIVSEIVKVFNNYKGKIRKAEPINFIFNNKPYSINCIINVKVMDLEKGTDITLPSGQIQIIMQNNELTRQLKMGQKFLKSNYIENKAYKIEGIDSISANGLLILTCTESQLNLAKDDIENQYANYIEVKHNYSIENKSGKDINMKLADKLQLDIVVKDNGVIVENPILKFTKNSAGIIDISQTGYIIGISSGSTILTIEFEGIKETINIKVEDMPKVEDNYTLELEGKEKVVIVCKYKLNCIVRNNGIEVNNTPLVTFRVENVDSFNKELAQIVENKNNKEITVQVTKDTNSVSKKFKIIASITNNEKIITQEKIVKITGVWG